MKNIFKATTGLFAVSLLAACSVTFQDTEAEKGQYYIGNVYNGVDAQPLTGYKMEVSYNAAEADDSGKPEVEIAKDGQYKFGPVRPGSDFMISITKEGFRDFKAIQDGEYYSPGGKFDTYTDYVEAWMFPSDIAVPPATLNLWSENVDQGRPTGTVRFAPQNAFNASSDLDLTNNFPTATQSGDTRWFNDLDAHNKVVMSTVDNGVVTVPVDQLVYGVSYDVTVYSVDGHRYDTFSFTAGWNGDQTIILSELSNADLQLVSLNTNNGQPEKSGKLVFTFNREVVLSKNLTAGNYAEILDDNFEIDAQDTDADGNENILPYTDDLPDVQETGTKITVSGNTVTLSWDGTLEDTDADDTIVGAWWQGLYGIEIQVVGEENQTWSLGDFVGDSEYVLMNSEPVVVP